MGKKLTDRVNYIGSELTLRLPNLIIGTLEYSAYTALLKLTNNYFEDKVPIYIGISLIPLATYATIDSGLRILVNNNLYNEKEKI
jgi:hypothetical protein